MPVRLCLDLNVWLGAILSERTGASTSAQMLVEAVRSGVSPRGPVALVISWGMLNRLRDVLDRFGFGRAEADRLIEVLATIARDGPSLTLGGVGVLPLKDEEDRHVLETAKAGDADMLVTQNLRDFTGPDVRVLIPDHYHGVELADGKLLIAHTYDGAAWLRGEPLPAEVAAFLKG
ncbi:PIN domain-containing protein [Caulobacter sp.]|uniref:PIN domain-containing protein n=1 Tax=Caulobacter sp. TaxID=78 RepID=UPI001B28C112|nr:PIN domain-containing protein [Caulobacter sp.]MBO9546722.1 PIN domain-containing protein [Caulobacter sp.]